MINKVKFDKIDESAVKALDEPSFNNLMKIAIDYSDAMVIGSKEIPDELGTYLKKSKKPVLEYHDIDNFAEAYTEFYKTQVLS